MDAIERYNVWMNGHWFIQCDCYDEWSERVTKLPMTTRDVRWAPWVWYRRGTLKCPLHVINTLSGYNDIRARLTIEWLPLLTMAFLSFAIETIKTRCDSSGKICRHTNASLRRKVACYNFSREGFFFLCSLKHTSKSLLSSVAFPRVLFSLVQ